MNFSAFLIYTMSSHDFTLIQNAVSHFKLVTRLFAGISNKHEFSKIKEWNKKYVSYIMQILKQKCIVNISIVYNVKKY